MASTGIMVLHKALLLPIPSSKCCQNQIFPLKASQFLSSNSLSMLKKKQQFRFPSVHVEQLRNQKLPIISAAQSSFLKGTLLISRLESVEISFLFSSHVEDYYSWCLILGLSDLQSMNLSTYLMQCCIIGDFVDS